MPEARPNWGARSPGRRGRPWWTDERVDEALRRYIAETSGPLPGNAASWNVAKRGRGELPTSLRVLLRYRSIARAWVVLGAPRRGCPLNAGPWTEDEEALLLELAGTLTLEAIGRRLHRSGAACKRRLYDLGTTARNNQGWLSIAQAAEQYGTSAWRLQRLERAGRLTAHRKRGAQNWCGLDAVELDALAAAGEFEPPAAPPPGWVTIKEASLRTGVCYATIYRRTRHGRLRSQRLGGVPYVCLDDVRPVRPRVTSALAFARAALAGHEAGCLELEPGDRPALLAAAKRALYAAARELGCGVRTRLVAGKALYFARVEVGAVA